MYIYIYILVLSIDLPQTRHFFSERLHPSVTHPGGLLGMERDGADNCLLPRLRSPDQNPNGDL